MLGVILGLIGGIVSVGVTASPAQATHFRATSLTWHATATPNEAEFHATLSARRSFYGSPVVGDSVQMTGVYYGDGFSDSPTFTVIFVDSANDYFIAEAHFSHTYSSPGPWTAETNSCCRLSGPKHINNPDDSNIVKSVVNLALTTSSPSSSISPIVDCAKNAVCRFSVPATDADNQGLRWRLANSSDGFGTQPGAPYATNNASVNASTGLYQWDTTGATLNTSGGDTYYSTQVVVENVVGTAVVATTAVDFFIRLSDSANSNQAPTFVPPTPADGTVINTTVGSSVTFGVAASDPDAADTVTLAILGMPAAASFANTPGNPTTGTFSWTPTMTGSTILTLIASDQAGLQATQRSVTINVGSTAPSGPTCDGKTATIVGTAGPDTINGTPGDDVIMGLAGRDSIRGNGGNDTICGGADNDVIYGDAGADRIFGQAGNDAQFGGVGNDYIDGGDGMDMVVGDGGDDTLHGGALTDKVGGGAGNDHLFGDSGSPDQCYGQGGTNVFDVSCESQS